MSKLQLKRNIITSDTNSTYEEVIATFGQSYSGEMSDGEVIMMSYHGTASDANKDGAILAVCSEINGAKKISFFANTDMTTLKWGTF